MKFLVTGGAGFIGSHLVDALIAQGSEVKIIDNLLTGKREYLNPKAEFLELDIRNLDGIRPHFEGIDAVFHLAALPRIPLSIEKPADTHAINATGALNVLIAARDAGVKKVVYSASSSAYGNQQTLPLREDMPASPLNPYAVQKYVGELYCRIFAELYGLQTVSLRYFNVYGPRQRAEGAYAPVMGIFLRQKAAGGLLTVTGDGEQTRDFTHVSDVARANILACESDKTGKGEIINIGGGKNYSVNDIARFVGGKISRIPERPGEIRHTLADITLAKKLLDWKPEFDLEEGIRILLS